MPTPPSPNDFSTDTEAVFTSDAFDHAAHHDWPIDEENFDEQYPYAGSKFARALQNELTLWTMPGVSLENHDEDYTEYEHAAWLLWLEHEGRSYTIRLYPVPTQTPLWWLSVSEDRGCLLAIFGRREPNRMPRSLQRKLQDVVERISETKDFRWTIEEEVMKLF